VAHGKPRGPLQAAGLGPLQAAGLGSQGRFAARGKAATHGRMHVPTTINIEIIAVVYCVIIS